MRLTGGPSFVFYRSQGEEILQLISSWKRPHYRPASNTSHCQSVNIDFLKFKLINKNKKYVKHYSQPSSIVGLLLGKQNNGRS